MNAVRLWLLGVVTLPFVLRQMDRSMPRDLDRPAGEPQGAGALCGLPRGIFTVFLGIFSSDP